MALEQADTAAAPPLEHAGDHKSEDSHSVLFKSVWDDMKALVDKTLKHDDSGRSGGSSILDLDCGNLYSSVHDATSTKGDGGTSPADRTTDSRVSARPGAPAVTINRDIDPQEYTVRNGDTLTKIAQRQLGPDASPAEIHQYVKEIAKQNHLKNPNLILDGQKLQLPGHTADGGYSTLDADGNKETRWKDGRLRVDYRDGTGLEMKPGGAGGYSEHHWGPKPQDNYDQVLKPDGTLEKTDSHGNKYTQYADGNTKVENKNGTGYTRNRGADGRYSEHHWGPHDEDNYDLAPQDDGSCQGKDKAGNEHTRWDDGSERVTYPDGRGYVRKPEADGGYSEHHWGTRPDENFDIKVGADGQIAVRERPGDKPHEQMDGDKVKDERDKLDKLAEQKIHDPEELAKFKADMARFDDRLKQMEETYEKEGLSPDDAHKKAQEQVEKTYGNISRLLEARDNPATGVDEARRTILAEQIMSQAANPTSIDQGIHPTCNVTTVESRTYTRDPADASQLVVDVATTGEYKTKDGQTITIDKVSMVPYDGARQNPPVDGQRSYASQIFQVTAVNIHYQRNGSLRYEQHKPDPTATPPDDGERLYDYSKNPPEEVKAGRVTKFLGLDNDQNYRAPGLADEEIVDVGNQISGDKADWFIRYGGDGDKGAVQEVETEKQLQDKLAYAKEHGELPIVVKVHSGNEPFWTDSGNGAAGGSGGWHVVTIQDYDAGPPAMVKLDNQWGSRVDHDTDGSMVSVHDLFHAMRDPKEEIPDLKKDVEYNRKKGIVDDYKELDLLRLERQNDEISEQEYAKQLNERIKEIGRHLKDNVPADPEEKKRLLRKLDRMTHGLPGAARLEALRQEHQAGILLDAVYDLKVGWEFTDLKKQRDKDIKDGKYDEDMKEEYCKEIAELKKILDEMPEKKKEELKEQIMHDLAH